MNKWTHTVQTHVFKGQLRMEYAVFSLHRLVESSILLWMDVWIVYSLIPL